MYIKCPKCETSYIVPEDYISEKGQNVKCANCANIWFQEKIIKEKVEASQNTIDDNYGITGFSITSNFLAEAVDSEEEKEREKETEEEFSGFNIEFTDKEEVKEEKAADGDFLSGLESLEEIDDELNRVIYDETEKNEHGIELDLDVLDEANNEVENFDENDKDDDLAALMQFAKSGIEIDEETEEVDEIVSRLSKFNKQSDDIEHSDAFLDKILFKIFKEKSKTMNIPLIKKYTAGLFIVLFLVFVGLFFHARYVIAKHIPVTRYVYNALRIPAVIAGEGLEFKNVTRREYEEDYERKMEIKGFIVNKTEETVDIPLIYVEILDKDGVFLQKQVAEASIESLGPGASTGFTVTIDSASRFAKYIVTNFKHKKGINGI